MNSSDAMDEGGRDASRVGAPSGSPLSSPSGSSRGPALGPALAAALDAAIHHAQKSWREGGIPIGSTLVDEAGTIVAGGHNRRVQDGDPTAHAEVVCIRSAGRRRDWARLTLVSTLSPCPMCSGTAILHRIRRVVIGENRSFMGAEEWMRGHGVELIVADDPRCVALMETLLREKPDLWAEDIGG